jgi:hypothetical protein
MSEKVYIGIVTDEYGNDEIGYNISSDVNKMLKWKKEMDTCNGVSECKIYEISKYSTILKYGKEFKPKRR